MIKKIILYFSIAIIVIIAIANSSYAAPVTAPLTAKLDAKSTHEFWTKDRINGAKPFIFKDTGSKDKTKSGAKNTTNLAENAKPTTDSDSDQQTFMTFFENTKGQANFPVGLLFFDEPEHGQQFCTASVINTPNGNIAVTAAHCLFDESNTPFNNIAFSPGYNEKTSDSLGPLGLIFADTAVAPAEFHADHSLSDYGMIKLIVDFPDGSKLQENTGANGWKLDASGDDILTTVLGYPQDGDMPDCTKDGHHLCEIDEKDVKSTDTEFIMSGVDLGLGVHGAPWMIEYDSDKKLGIMYGNFVNHDFAENQSESPRYDPADFNGLIELLSKS